MRIAIISLLQKKHDDIFEGNTLRGCGYTTPYYQIPLKPGHTIALGRSPIIEKADEVIYIPSDYITRHIGYIRCIETNKGELLHVLTLETNKHTLVTPSGLPIPREYIFKNGDKLKVEGLPISLIYAIPNIPSTTTEIDDLEDSKLTANI